MIIESISPQNLEALTHLTLELWNDCDYGEEYTFWQSVLQKNEDFCVLAKDLENYVGFIHLSIRTDYVEGTDADSVPYIEGIYIRPTHRNKGLAKLLLSSAENWAKSKGYTQIASDAELDNWSSIDFHKSVGFQEVNRVVCFLKNL